VRLTVSFPKWPFFRYAAFSAAFNPQRTTSTPAVETFVRPCSLKKLHIYELETCVKYKKAESKMILPFGFQQKPLIY